MSKTYLVAAREYLENLRTKTFWIGILAFPLMIVVSIVVSKLLNEAKDVRTYAVIDHSQGQWVSKAIDELAAKRGLAALAQKTKDKLGTDTEGDGQGSGNSEKPLPTAAEVRASIQTKLDSLSQSSPLRPLLTTYLQLDDKDLVAPLHGEQMSTKARQELLAAALEVAGNPKAVDELKQFAGDALPEKTKRIAVPDVEDPEAALGEMVQKGELFAYFIIGDQPLEGSQGFRYVSNNHTDTELRNDYAHLATDVVQQARIDRLQKEKNLTAQEAHLIGSPIVFESKGVDEKGKEKEVSKTEKVSQFAPVAFVYLLWIAVFTAAQMLLTNTVEEKSNRLIEVLLSSVSPLQLMAGKVFGIAATGLTVVGSWVLCAVLAVTFLPHFLGGLGDLDLGSILGDPLYLGSFIGYFLAGYMFYAALLVGIGSVCNSLKEAQNLMQPVFLLLIVPLLAMIPVVNDPNGTLARVLTYIPPFTPFVMMNRAAGPPPLWEYVASSIVIVVSVGVAFWAAGKVFRIGVLMTGKPPRLREILGWLKAPIGSMPHQRQPGAAPARG